ncbi:MAG: transposase, partial [Longimicrobiales bacterium]
MKGAEQRTLTAENAEGAEKKQTNKNECCELAPEKWTHHLGGATAPEGCVMARRFSKEFKLQAVQRVIEEDRPVAEVAR